MKLLKLNLPGGYYEIDIKPEVEIENRLSMYLPIRRYKNSTFILQYPQYMITTNGDKVVETK